MMNISVNKNSKSCGTCGYWTGSRTIDHSYTFTLVEGNSSGGCGNSKGSGIHSDRKAQTSGCNLYTMWSALKH